MPHPEPVQYAANSLWQSGSRSFFKDQRARQIGDILTVVVTITDKAEIDNATERTRSGSDSVGAGGAVGTAIDKFLLPAGSSASDLADVSSSSSQSGSGTVDRSETLETTVAAVVTQVLPNGNLVIEGRQEVRVNFEVRELIVAGVIRPEDIGAENTIDSSKIAEARIAYGGRGQITDVQQPRYGSPGARYPPAVLTLFLRRRRPRPRRHPSGLPRELTPQSSRPSRSPRSPGRTADWGRGALLPSAPRPDLFGPRPLSEACEAGSPGPAPPVPVLPPQKKKPPGGGL